MFGKIENGKFVPAHSVKSVTHQGNRTVIERYSADELKGMGNKEVYTADGTGHPGPGYKPSPVYEDKGAFILRTLNWVQINNSEED